MSPSFSIYRFITSVRKDYPTLGPDELTEKVLASLPIEDERAALEQCLRHTVSGAITSSSRDRPFLIPDAVKAEPSSSSSNSSSSSGKRDSTRSWKTRVSRQWKINLEVTFKGAEAWIPFGDSTKVDLLHGAKTRRDEAAELAESAIALELWADLLDEYKVTRVRDLPESVLRERLEGTAP